MFFYCVQIVEILSQSFFDVLKLGISWAKNGKNGSQIEAPVPMVFLICPEGNILSQSLLVMSQSWAFFGPKIASLGLKLRWVSQWYFVNVQKVEKLSQSYFVMSQSWAFFGPKIASLGLKLRWVSQWYFVNVQKVEKLSQSFFCYVPKLAIFWTKNGTNGSQSEVRVPMTFILSPKGSRFCPN